MLQTKGFCPENGAQLDLLTDIQREFIRKIHMENTEKALEWLATVKNQCECTYPRPHMLQWDGDESVQYVLELAETSDFKAATCVVTTDNFYALENLKTGQDYFWRVNGGEIHHFQTMSSAARFIKLEGALNVRDLGGSNIKQGLL